MTVTSTMTTLCIYNCLLVETIKKYTTTIYIQDRQSVSLFVELKESEKNDYKND